MKVIVHYIEELNSGKWRWTHVPQGGLMPSRGPKIGDNGQITLNNKQYTVDSRFNRTTVSPRPGWAIGLIFLGVGSIVSAAEAAAYVIGALSFFFIGLIAVVGGIWNYQKAFHVYALFIEGQTWQVPFIRQFPSIQVIKEIVDTSAHHVSEAAKAKKISEFIHPELPWPIIIAAAVVGLGGGMVIGIIAANFR